MRNKDIFMNVQAAWDEWSEVDGDDDYLLRFIVYESKRLSLVSVWPARVVMPFDGESCCVGSDF